MSKYTTVEVTSRPEQVVYAGDGVTLLYNSDPNFPIFIGDDLGCFAGGTNVVPIPPTGSYTVDGKSIVYAAALQGQTPTLYIIPGGLRSGNPGGTPLMHGVNNIDNNFVTPTIAIGGSYTTPITPIDKPGYIIALQHNPNVASAFPFIQVTLRWYDQTGSFIIWREDWIIPGNSPPGPGRLAIFGQGPVRGGWFSLQFTNLDPSSTASVQYSVCSTSHDIARDDWRTGAPFNAPPGFTYPPLGNSPGMPSNVLVLTGPTFTQAAGQANTWLLPLYAGQAYLSLSVTPSTAATNGTLSINPVSNTNNAPVFNAAFNVPATLTTIVEANQVITLPRHVCQLTITSAAASGIVWDISIVAQEYAS